MRCPYCNSDRIHCVSSRPQDDGAVVRRRKACYACGRRFWTTEVYIPEDDIMYYGSLEAASSQFSDRYERCTRRYNNQYTRGGDHVSKSRR